MKKYPFLFLFILGLPFLGFTQENRIVDSLRSDLHQHPSKDTLYLDKSFKLLARLVFSDPAEEGLRLSKSTIHIADSLGDTFRLAKAWNLLANCYKNTGLNDKAMEGYLKSLELFESLHDEYWVSNLHSNLAIIFLNKGDLEQSRKEQQIALDIRHRIKNFKGISGMYNGMGNLYDQLGDSEKSLEFYQRALDSAASNGNPYDLGIYLGNIGNAYGRLKKFDLCIQYNRQSLQLHQRLNLPNEISRDLHNIGEAFFRLGKTDSATSYLEKAFHSADTMQYHLVRQASSNVLAEMNKKAGKYERALYWNEISRASSDSLHRQQLSNESKAMEMAYRVEQKEREDKYTLETENLQKDEALKRQRILTYSFGMGFLLLGGFGFVVNKRYREKKHANSLLEEKVKARTSELKNSNDRLIDEIRQKEQAAQTLSTFIYRSSHDLKGPLTSMKGLVDMAKAEIPGSQVVNHLGAKAAQLDRVLQQLIDKVEVDARVVSPQPVDWTRIWNELRSEMQQHPGGEQLEMEFSNQLSQPLHSDPVLLKIALRQLLLNAVDFRRPEGAHVMVQVKPSVGNAWTLEVQDNGIGIESAQLAQVWDMFYRGSNASRGAGLGLYLVKEIAGKLGLKNEIISDPGEGTRVRLVHKG